MMISCKNITFIIFFFFFLSSLCSLCNIRKLSWSSVVLTVVVIGVCAVLLSKLFVDAVGVVVTAFCAAVCGYWCQCGPWIIATLLFEFSVCAEVVFHAPCCLVPPLERGASNCETLNMTSFFSVLMLLLNFFLAVPVQDVTRSQWSNFRMSLLLP